MKHRILAFLLILAACEAIPTPASQSIGVVSVGGHPVSYYHGR